MALIDQLASSTGRKDEGPNQELARGIAIQRDSKSVQELIHLVSNGNRAVQNDGIKVLYEIGNLNPSLISDHVLFFIRLLKNKNNRLHWGAMMALDAIATEYPGLVYPHLSEIMASAGQGSVITKDHVVNILVKLCTHEAWASTCFDLLFELIESSANNQFPMYAERILPVVSGKFTSKLIRMLEARLPAIPRESGRKRVLKVIKKLSAP